MENLDVVRLVFQIALKCDENTGIQYKKHWSSIVFQVQSNLCPSHLPRGLFPSERATPLHSQVLPVPNGGAVPVRLWLPGKVPHSKISIADDGPQFHQMPRRWDLERICACLLA